jgi:NAD(P)H-dependent flavin oxidoreductase YrpB (nitropropane dioxygenase family)
MKKAFRGENRMIKTKLCDLLGIRYPIIQAGMGPYSTNNLAIASANSGILGIISTSGAQLGMLGQLAPYVGEGTPYEITERMIRRVAEHTGETKGIFGMNVMVSAELREAAEPVIQAAVDVRAADAEVNDRMRVIITTAGDPMPWADIIKPSGIKWFHAVGSVRQAKRCEKAGVDGIIAQGQEAAAHVAWEPVHTMVILPAVASAVKVPVVGTGGFCDGASLVAGLALGASGVQMGTRFIATQEAEFVPVLKEAILKRDERETIIARGLVGPARYLKNKASMELTEITTRKTPTFFQGIPDTALDPEIWAKETQSFMGLLEGGEEDETLLPGGEVAGRIDNLPTVAELVEEIMRQAEETLAALGQCSSS